MIVWIMKTHTKTICVNVFAEWLAVCPPSTGNKAGHCKLTKGCRNRLKREHPVEQDRPWFSAHAHCAHAPSPVTFRVFSFLLCSSSLHHHRHHESKLTLLLSWVNLAQWDSSRCDAKKTWKCILLAFHSFAGEHAWASLVGDERLWNKAKLSEFWAEGFLYNLLAMWKEPGKGIRRPRWPTTDHRRLTKISRAQSKAAELCKLRTNTCLLFYATHMLYYLIFCGNK